MISLSTLLRRLRSLFLGSHLDRDMDEELRFHVERQIEDHIKAGMAPQEARYAAGVPLGEGAVYDVRYSLVSSGYFEVLGVVPVLGRALDERDLMRADGAVIGYGLWERAFGRDPGVLGRNLRIGGRPYTIV